MMLVVLTTATTRAATPSPDGPIYQVLSTVLAPFAAVLFNADPAQPSAFAVEARVRAASGRLAATRGAQVRLVAQSPDRARLDIQHAGTTTTLCRQGDSLWATPAEPMRELAERSGLSASTAKASPPPPTLLPVVLTPQQIAFLPLAFAARDVTAEEAEEQSATRRVVEFTLLPELQRAAGARDFAATVWLGSDGQPHRVRLEGSDSMIDLDVRRLAFGCTWPESVWEPASRQDVFRLPAGAAQEMFEEALAAGAFPEAAPATRLQKGMSSPASSAGAAGAGRPEGRE